VKKGVGGLGDTHSLGNLYIKRNNLAFRAEVAPRVTKIKSTNPLHFPATCEGGVIPFAHAVEAAVRT
jgi:hypothetical protein